MLETRFYTYLIIGFLKFLASYMFHACSMNVLGKTFLEGVEWPETPLQKQTEVAIWHGQRSPKRLWFNQDEEYAKKKKKKVVQLNSDYNQSKLSKRKVVFSSLTQVPYVLPLGQYESTVHIIGVVKMKPHCVNALSIVHYHETTQPALGVLHPLIGVIKSWLLQIEHLAHIRQ